jgi:hypothetical protein
MGHCILLLMTTRLTRLTIGCSCSTFLILALTSCSTGSTKKASIELFNGRDLNGWDYVSADPQVSMDQVWSVQDGILTCKGTPVGAIYRGPAVTNFRMSVDYRWAPGATPGNSGIFSRISLPPKPIPQAVEVQLKHGSNGDVMGLQGRQVAAGQSRFFTVKQHPVAGDIAGVKKLADLEKTAGEWNHIEILAQGAHYEVWINGQLANEADGVETLSGPVGLQSEENVVQFRHVRLTPLD